MADDELEHADDEPEPEPEVTEPDPKRRKPAHFMKKVQGVQSRLDTKVKKLENTEGFITKMLQKQTNVALTKK